MRMNCQQCDLTCEAMASEGSLWLDDRDTVFMCIGIVFLIMCIVLLGHALLLLLWYGVYTQCGTLLEKKKIDQKLQADWEEWLKKEMTDKKMESSV